MTDTNKKNDENQKTTMEKLEELNKRINNLGKPPLKERIAVPNPNGGYYIKTIEIK